MTGFTFSAEQVKSAPPEVRRWIESEISKALGVSAAAPANPSKMEESALAICAADEIAELFKLISGNFFVMQVLFELGRETPVSHAEAPLHSFSLGEMLRHAQLADGNQLFECFDVINRALQKIRNDPNASVFAFDEASHVYIHETTYRSIRQVWGQLVLAHSLAGKSQPTDTGNAASFGLPPIRAEPYEPIMQPEHAFAGPKAGAI
ncbi:hypothetical protein RZS28_05195 [Methylocapsa polymorpha]|uniref:Uncharacterized protein n=1 Tax=Methylocapsa polymorpha TaxID=3080828 RepID=A0ABZ0HVU9_9HYPH|nr:hypothetical protein RZS28_05195 [Methylocapsa sp. RX1]